jgi:hypothetical protein
MTTAHFFGETPALARSKDLMKAYRAWLERRNGPGFATREQRMASDFDAARVDATLPVDAARVYRNYSAFKEKGVGAEELALLAFAKMNAGEAWGVEVVSKARERQQQQPGVTAEVERLVTGEEQFHTRLLVGAAAHFHDSRGAGRLAFAGGWRPPAALRTLIGGLVLAPRTLFHPLLLAAEVAGVYGFNWMLRRLDSLFPNAPHVRESMQRRLIEVLIDEVGHITFNRLLVGRFGRGVARLLAQRVIWLQRQTTPELKALGMNASVVGRLGSFDFADLPDEVKRRAFFA